jgi:hypothetical protein
MRSCNYYGVEIIIIIYSFVTVVIRASGSSAKERNTTTFACSIMAPKRTKGDAAERQWDTQDARAALEADLALAVLKSRLGRRGQKPHAWMVWCGVVWCGVVWCGVVWCGVVWCGVVWCGVVWRRCTAGEGGGVMWSPRPGCYELHGDVVWGRRYQEAGERLTVETFRLTDELARQKLTLQAWHATHAATCST